MKYASGEASASHAGSSIKARVGIVVDASCDVPDAFLTDPDVSIIPIPIRIRGQTYVDQHDPDATRRYMRENANGEGAEGQSVPLDAEALHQFFLERFAVDYDSVYCFTITQNRSPIFEAASQGLQQAQSAIRAQRQAAGIHRPLQFRVIDTRQMFAGSGVAPLAVWDMVKAGKDPKEIRETLFRVIDCTYAYSVPDDLAYARARSRVRGDRSIGLFSSLLGSAMDIKPLIRVHQGDTDALAKYRGRKEAWGRLFELIGRLVTRGLLVPHVVVSYAGALDDVLRNPDYAVLRQQCAVEGVQLHTLTMSITGMMNFGPGGIVIGLAAPEHRHEL